MSSYKFNNTFMNNNFFCCRRSWIEKHSRSKVLGPLSGKCTKIRSSWDPPLLLPQTTRKATGSWRRRRPICREHSVSDFSAILFNPWQKSDTIGEITKKNRRKMKEKKVVFLKITKFYLTLTQIILKLYSILKLLF